MATYKFNNPYGEEMAFNYYHRLFRSSVFDSSGYPLVNGVRLQSDILDGLYSLTLPRTGNVSQYNAIVANSGFNGISPKLRYPDNAAGMAISGYSRNKVPVYRSGDYRDRRLFSPTYFPTPPTGGARLSVYNNSNRTYCIFDTHENNFGLNIKRVYSVPLTSASFADPSADSSTFIIGDLRDGEAVLPLSGFVYTDETWNSSGGGLWLQRVYSAVYRRTTADKLVFRFKHNYTIQGTAAMGGNSYPTVLVVAIVPDRVSADYVVPNMQRVLDPSS